MLIPHGHFHPPNYGLSSKPYFQCLLLNTVLWQNTFHVHLTLHRHIWFILVLPVYPGEIKGINTNILRHNGAQSCEIKTKLYFLPLTFKSKIGLVTEFQITYARSYMKLKNNFDITFAVLYDLQYDEFEGNNTQGPNDGNSFSLNHIITKRSQDSLWQRDLFYYNSRCLKNKHPC